MTPTSGVADQFIARLGGWAQRNMDMLFMAARNLVPILVVTYQGKTFVLVSRHDDVREVMSLPNVFRVPYAPKLHVIMGGGKSAARRLREHLDRVIAERKGSRPARRPPRALPQPGFPRWIGILPALCTISAAKSASCSRPGSQILTDATGERRNPRRSQHFRGLRDCRHDPFGESGSE